MLTVGLKEFSEHFGCEECEISNKTKDIIQKYDFSYKECSQEERDEIINQVIDKIKNDEQEIGSPIRTDIWTKGWGENLTAFNENHSEEAFTPKFIRPSEVIRLNGDFVKPKDFNFERNFSYVIRSYICENYLIPYKNIHEFGSGSGFHLIPITRRFPDKNIFGSDFVQTAVDLINNVAKHYDYNLSASLFNLIQPNSNYKIPESSVVCTFGAIEQIASKFDNFLDFLLERKPELCIHIEPAVEMYDDKNLVYSLAIKFHRKRGYSEGMIPKLEAMDKSGKIKLLKIKRLNFGGLMFEGFTLMIWKPL
jgi:hypothetical protein